MDFKKLEHAETIADTAIVRVKTSGNIVELMHSEKHAHGAPCVKVNKDWYCDTRTGEAFECVHTTNRAQNLSSVAKSIARGRDLINANVTDVDKVRWITFTYAENMKDVKRLEKDWKRTHIALERKYGHFDYIIQPEPQGRGAWHLHALLIFKDKAPYMANKDVAGIWKQGFVTVKALEDCDNIGAYLSAYLGDMELQEALDNKVPVYGVVKTVDVDVNGIKVKKSYVKGARLSLYPTNMKMFRHSRGILEPVIETEVYKTAKEKAGLREPTFSNSIQLSDDCTGYENTITYEYYNKLRKNKQE